MNILIPVFFNAPLGGLQDHVQAIARALRDSNHRPVVACKPGPYSTRLQADHIQVLETSFTDLEADIAACCAQGPFDLVHAHPFASRRLGLETARELGVPFIVTFHGTYLDSLSAWSEDVDCAIAVSGSIRDFLIRSKSIEPERISVIPNGVDTSVFQPKVERGRKRNALPLVLFASRLDSDKQFIIDLVLEAWNEIIDSGRFDHSWLVVGDGSERPVLERLAHQVNDAAGRDMVNFFGWAESIELPQLMQGSDLVIAPGRSALEAMACGIATIALGSKGYVGLIEPSNVMHGVYGNFGGHGNRDRGSANGRLYGDIRRALQDPAGSAELGNIGLHTVETFFDQQNLNEHLLRLYSLCSHLSPRHRKTSSLSLVPVSQDLPLTQGHPPKLNTDWGFPVSDARLSVSAVSAGTIGVDSSLEPTERFYLTHGVGGLNVPPDLSSCWSIKTGTFYEVEVYVDFPSGSCQCQMWTIQYGQNERIDSRSVNLLPGKNLLRFQAASNADRLRMAFRLSGAGRVRLGSLRLHKLV